ncbi:BufA2 family periplasmic bufferin-type metallophore [Cupriavidus pampae]|uniref:Silver efflux pump n=1 Tax=Cupriavidus pampae TaxID=659251 RepID=A0ABN7YHS6_9BURK|nr:hypothetical protein [Cupriavidus pampae]CAG9171477.1 hypothetical protein LMG32289_02382 [Cupriavidus pampae]
MTVSNKSRASLATAAALLALASAAIAVPAHAAGKAEPVRCYGVNSCKGESLCATASNDCKGLNSCKGKGVVVKSKSECLKAGGKLTEQ